MVGFKSIAQRWFVNSFAVIFAILLAIVSISGIFIQNYYYSSVRQALNYRVNSALSMINQYSQNNYNNFHTYLRSYVESFPDKDSIELMAIDSYGKISITSSGFLYSQKDRMADYQDALASTDGTGYYVGEFNGQKIMAVTKLVSVVNGEFSALRFVVSLENVDSMVLRLMIGISVAALLILALVFISGLLFVRSIVHPVRDIGIAARRIAGGDFKSRIEKTSQDEVGELCETINFMADELENSEKMKNEFISSVSHELRTPLTAIKGWAETLIDTENYDVATMKKGMKVISSETERLSEMVEELLDFSRIQNGRFSLSFQKMDLLAELGEAALIYSEKAKKENIEFIYEEPEMLPVIYGDKNRLRQVFINIIDNAIKYSDPGGRVKIEVFEREENIVIIVSDSGCGISVSDLPMIKTKFFKANHTRRGSGIGLSVANEIITMHNGTLDIESTINVGTTVIIKIPVKNPDEEIEE